MDFKEFIKNAQKYQKGKVCNICKEHKPFSEFHKNRKAKDGRRNECSYCSLQYKNSICKFKRWFTSKKAGVKAGYYLFTIEPTDIPGVKIRETITIDRMGRKYKSWEAIEYPKVCPVLGLELDWGMSGKQQPDSPSLDRIDSTKSYIPGNVMMMSTLANKMKSHATPEQLKQFSRYHLFGVRTKTK